MTDSLNTPDHAPDHGEDAPDQAPERDPARAADGGRGHPRICLCVLMNHPFPANLPLLRAIYAGRFSEVRFLIPFERLDDPDVVTVYRGSYVHAAYLTDARHILSPIDCDYYLVVHDDVLLNPMLSEATFRDAYGLGPDDGFIAQVAPTQTAVGRNSWLFGYAPKFLFPKSLLFGSGIEADTLARFLPHPDELAAAFAANGVAGTPGVELDTGLALGADTFGSPPSRVLLHGLSGAIGQGAPQRAVEADSAIAEEALVRAMLGAVQVASIGRVAPGESDVPLPIPTVTSNYFTDFYIVPKSGFDRFCHLTGVAGAANLFVEIIAPTLLHAVCARVRTAADAGLDFSGFDRQRALDAFTDPRTAAIHPFKLSAFRAAGARDALLAALGAIAAGGRVPDDNPYAHVAFGRWNLGFVGVADGWHQGEDWGVWSRGDATIPMALPAPATLYLTLRRPGVGTEAMTGALATADGRVVPLRVEPGSGDLLVAVDDIRPDGDGVARIALVTDIPVRPCDDDPDSGDGRRLGFGLVRIDAVH